MNSVIQPTLASELAGCLSPASVVRRDEALGRRTTLQLRTATQVAIFDFGKEANISCAVTELLEGER